ncbi:F-box family protein [Artemisia annua]|uniref:F-box family protein n=1 Tax=Artemisia annua TaxID=35608 RepID=A0A2U1KD18_ARTAN|nr:F-box family protein [Artemisia annua]
MFNSLSDDLILNIFTKLIDDPRDWSRAACACTKFSSLIRTVCWKNKCHLLIPAVVSDLVPPSAATAAAPPGGWSALFKLAVCCPGLVHAGVLLEHSDFGLERDLGPDEGFRVSNGANSISNISNGSSSKTDENNECGWSLYDDLYLDTVYNDVSKSNVDVVERKVCRSGSGRLNKAHLASEMWNFSREQGNKLLASRFRGDCLYVCDWPGCVHTEEKRNYMLFRGVFKNFKMSRVWRTIKDGNKSKIDLNCAYCSSNDVWDMHSAFCLRPAYGFHDDGEPVVRAYVCENGHVSGAWTDWPLYT